MRVRLTWQGYWCGEIEMREDASRVVKKRTFESRTTGHPVRSIALNARGVSVVWQDLGLEIIRPAAKKGN
jgi:hypothetical protein